MKYYLLNHPRPIGLEPRVYQQRPEISPEIVEVEPGYFLTDPYSDPEILEFTCLKEALLAVVNFNSSDSYLESLTVLPRTVESK